MGCGIGTCRTLNTSTSAPEYWHCLGIDPETRAHTPDEFIDVVFPEDLPNVLKNLDEHYADPSVPYEQTVRFRHADGSTVWVRCRGLAIRDAQGKAIRMLGAHNNITQAKEAELLAVKQAKLLARAYDELKQLTYRVSPRPDRAHQYHRNVNAGGQIRSRQPLKLRPTPPLRNRPANHTTHQTNLVGLVAFFSLATRAGLANYRRFKSNGPAGLR